MTVRPEAPRQNRDEPDRQQHDQDDCQPVDDGTWEVRARRLVPREAWIAGVAGQARECAEGVSEPGVQQSSASDECGEVADEPVAASSRRRGADGKHEQRVVVVVPSRRHLGAGHRVTGSR
ncbi:MAG: hypothetical protein ACRD2W_03370 [Acidimicrobiales bacterium]